MAWIESHQSLRSHPKTKRLARALSLSVPTVIGHLHCLWWWSLDYASDGDLSAFEAWEIAEGAMWEGDPETFLTALEDAAFYQDGKLHDWHDYAGRLIHSRDKARERMAALRAKRGGDDPAPTPVTRERPAPAEAVTLVPERKGGSRSVAITAAWEPSPEAMAWATGQWPESWVRSVTETFRDYYIGTGKPMKNWEATWRNWLRRDATRNPPKQEPSAGNSPGDWFEA